MMKVSATRDLREHQAAPATVLPFSIPASQRLLATLLSGILLLAVSEAILRMMPRAVTAVPHMAARSTTTPRWWFRAVRFRTIVQLLRMAVTAGQVVVSRQVQRYLRVAKVAQAVRVSAAPFSVKVHWSSGAAQLSAIPARAGLGPRAGRGAQHFIQMVMWALLVAAVVRGDGATAGLCSTPERQA